MKYRIASQIKLVSHSLLNLNILPFIYKSSPEFWVGITTTIPPHNHAKPCTSDSIYRARHPYTSMVSHAQSPYQLQSLIYNVRLYTCKRKQKLSIIVMLFSQDYLCQCSSQIVDFGKYCFWKRRMKNEIVMALLCDKMK